MFVASSYSIKNKLGDKSVIFKNVAITRYKCLGVELDERLNWGAHINEIC